MYEGSVIAYLFPHIFGIGAIYIIMHVYMMKEVVNMRRLVMLVFMVISLIALAAITYSVSDLMSLLNSTSFSWSDLLDLIESTPLEDLIPALSVVLWGLFQIYGIPLIVFLVSFNGLMQKTRVVVKTNK